MEGYPSFFCARSEKGQPDCVYRNMPDDPESDSGPLDMTAEAYSACCSNTSYTNTGAARSYQLSPYTFHHGRGRSIETAYHLKPLQSASLLSASYQCSIPSEPYNAGRYKSPSPLHFTSSYPSMTPISESECRYSGEYVKYAPKNMNISRQFDVSSLISANNHNMNGKASPVTTGKSCRFSSSSSLSAGNYNSARQFDVSSLICTEDYTSSGKTASFNESSSFHMSKRSPLPANNCKIQIQDHNTATVMASSLSCDEDVKYCSSSPMSSNSDQTFPDEGHKNEQTSPTLIPKSGIVPADLCDERDVVHLSDKETSSSCSNAMSVGINMEVLLSDKSNTGSEEINTENNSSKVFPKEEANNSNTLSDLKLEIVSFSDMSTSKRCKAVTAEKNGKIESIARPPYSYVALIQKAILESPQKRLTLQEIYEYIIKNFEYYQYCEPSWKNSIRHNLSLNKCFYREPREGAGVRKGGYWLFDTTCQDDFQNNNFKRRVRMKGIKKNSSSKSNVPTTTQNVPIMRHVYPHQYYGPSLIAHGYRTNDRNWTLSHMSSHPSRSSFPAYPSCPERLQAMNARCVSTPHLGAIPTTSAHTLPPTYATASYIPQPASYADRHPAHCIPQPVWTGQQNQRYRT